MSKILKAVGLVAGAVSVVATFGGSTPLIAGLANAKLASISGAVGALASTGASLLRKPKAQGTTSNITINTNAPQPYTMGRTFYGGTLIHDVGYGLKNDDVENPYRSQVFVYSGAGPVESFDTFLLDQKAISLNYSDWGNANDSYYHDHLHVSFQLGESPESGRLVGAHSRYNPINTVPQWGNAYKLSGYAASMVNLRWDEDSEKYTSGAPASGWVGKWVKCYDPRKDSTYPGGSGTHRALDETTYEWTENPFLHGLTYALGRYQNGKRVFGIGMPIDGIDVPAFVAGANMNDLNGWKLGGTIFEPATETKFNNLKMILQAGGGIPGTNNGRLSCSFSAPKVSLTTLTENDMADGEAVIPATQSYRDRINTIVPQYRSEAHYWEYVTGSEVTEATYVTADGENKKKEERYTLVQDKDQCGQLAAYDIVNSRELGPITLKCKPRMVDYGAGESLTLDLPNYGLSGQFNIIKSDYSPAEGVVEIVLTSETPAKHAYALGQSTTPPEIPTIKFGPDLDYIASNQNGEQTTIRVNVVMSSVDKGLALTAEKTGSTAKVIIPAHTRYYTNKSKSVDAGEVTGLALETLYYIYYDDAAVNGGAVTYAATTTQQNAQTSADNPSRHYVGYVTTPASEGPTTTTGTTATPPTQVPERVPNADVATNTENVGSRTAQQILDGIDATISQPDLDAATDALTQAIEDGDAFEAEAREQLEDDIDDVNFAVTLLSASTENNRIDLWPNGFANGLADWTQTSSVTALPSECVPPSPGIWALNQFGNLVNLISGAQSIFMKYKGPVPPARKHAQICRMRVTTDRTGGGTARALIQTFYFLGGVSTGSADSTIIDLRESDGFQDFRRVMPNAQTVVHDATFTRVITNLNSGDDAVWEVSYVTIKDVDETEKLDARAEVLEAFKVSTDAQLGATIQTLNLLDNFTRDPNTGLEARATKTQFSLLETALGEKASITNLEALEGTVNDADTGLGAVNNNLQTISVALGDKAESSDLANLAATVSTNTTNISSKATNEALNQVIADVAGKASTLSLRRLRNSMAVIGDLGFAEGLPGYVSNQFSQNPEAENPNLNEWVYTTERNFPAAKLTGFPSGTSRALAPLQGLIAEAGAKYEAKVSFQIENTSGIASNNPALVLRIRNYSASGAHILSKAGLGIDRGPQGVVQTFTLLYTADSSDIMLKPIIENDDGLNTGVRIYIKELSLTKIDAQILDVQEIATRADGRSTVEFFTDGTTTGGRTLIRGRVHDDVNGTTNANLTLASSGSIDLAILDGSGNIDQVISALTIEGDKALFSGRLAGREVGVIHGDIFVPAALETVEGSGRHGNFISYGGNVPVQPVWKFDLSGLPALAAGKRYVVEARNRTPNAAQIYAQILDSTGQTTITETGDSAGTGSNPDRIMQKSNAGDGPSYRFRVKGAMTVTSFQSGGEWINSGSVTLQTYFNDGGGYDEGPTINLNQNDAGIQTKSPSSLAGSYVYDVVVTVPWGNVIGANGTAEFGCSKIGGNGTFTDLVSVAYDVPTGATYSNIPNNPFIPYEIKHKLA